MGYTRGSQYIYFNVNPGKHQIMSKAENWDLIEVQAKEKEIIFIQQEASMGFVMARNKLSQLDEMEGKYRVKELEMGTIIKMDK